MTRKEKKQLREEGAVRTPSDYAAEGYLITMALIDDGETHLFGDRLIETGCPVHILQGIEDTDVPWSHATQLVSRLASDDVVLTLGAGRRPILACRSRGILDRLIAAVEGVTAMD